MDAHQGDGKGWPRCRSVGRGLPASGFAGGLGRTRPVGLAGAALRPLLPHQADGATGLRARRGRAGDRPGCPRPPGRSPGSRPAGSQPAPRALDPRASILLPGLHSIAGSAASGGAAREPGAGWRLTAPWAPRGGGRDVAAAPAARALVQARRGPRRVAPTTTVRSAKLDYGKLRLSRPKCSGLRLPVGLG